MVMMAVMASPVSNDSPNSENTVLSHATGSPTHGAAATVEKSTSPANAATAYDTITPSKMGTIFTMPLPQMLHTTMTAIATTAMSQFDEAFVMAEEARISPVSYTHLLGYQALGSLHEAGPYALRVHRAARVDAAVIDVRCERVVRPADGVRVHHVVMCHEHDGRELAVGALPQKRDAAAVDQLQFAGFEHGRVQPAQRGHEPVEGRAVGIGVAQVPHRGDAQQSAEAVSYTHLDVYKRQAWWRAWWWWPAPRTARTAATRR